MMWLGFRNMGFVCAAWLMVFATPGRAEMELGGKPTEEGVTVVDPAEEAQADSVKEEAKPPAIDPSKTWKGFRAEGDPELDRLRHETYRVELELRLARAKLDLREAERKLKGRPEPERPKVVERPTPPPKVDVLAADRTGVTVKIDGEQMTFDRPGQSKGGVTFEGIEGNRVLLNVRGRDVSARF